MRRLIAFALLISTASLLCGFQQGKILAPIMQQAPVAGGGNPAFVNVGTGSTFINTPPGTVSTAAQSVTAGNALVVGCGVTQSDAGTPANTTVTDTAGDTFVRDQAHNEVNSGKGIVVFHVLSSAGNASNVTVCHSTLSSNDVSVIAVQVSSPGALDANVSGDNTATNVSPVTSSTFSTVRANEIALAFVMTTFGRGTNTFTNGAGYTIPAGGSVIGGAGDNFAAIQYQVFSATQSGVTSSFSWSGGAGSAAIGVVSF